MLKVSVLTESSSWQFFREELERGLTLSIQAMERDWQAEGVLFGFLPTTMTEAMIENYRHALLTYEPNHYDWEGTQTIHTEVLAAMSRFVHDLYVVFENGFAKPADILTWEAPVPFFQFNEEAYEVWSIEDTSYETMHRNIKLTESWHYFCCTMSGLFARQLVHKRYADQEDLSSILEETNFVSIAAFDFEGHLFWMTHELFNTMRFVMEGIGRASE